VIERFDCIWDALEDTPAKAENMKMRSELMIALNQRVSGLTQAQAATLLGVTQPRVSDLSRGKLHLFALEKLVKMATTAGLRIEMKVLQPA
jgi:predicted XRE-type DNA-binding protein